ncbi:general transcription factor IIE subunit 2-like [Teleopsis dalmanni]|uniref:general transcription factor IIE subunit 2-like n=2 Tax=Teleopsis dalmanni TaxID=139649 RepID=UPI0018CEA68B|nr:general transcription factor IIE subunit 2-like [Teleopsis dalmanni]XP_037953353.1 general transcription factor IIE subunit 2-like [Teleopsis dalmanni]
MDKPDHSKDFKEFAYSVLPIVGKQSSAGSKKKYGFSNGHPLETNKSFTSKFRFGVLTTIVKHMQVRYKSGNDLKLSLDEILNETGQQNIDDSIKKWLAYEALVDNPKIDTSADKKKFSFKPIYKVQDGKSLMRLLRRNHIKGLGGVLLEEIEESLQNVDKVLKAYAKNIIIVTRPGDKKKILFYNDHFADDMHVDESIQKMWRSIDVDSVEDLKIDNHLKEAGISCLKGSTPIKPVELKRKAPAKAYQLKKRVDNEHVQDILETYEDQTVDQKEMELGNIHIA